jgi:hypothetical protein
MAYQLLPVSIRIIDLWGGAASLMQVTDLAQNMCGEVSYLHQFQARALIAVQCAFSTVCSSEAVQVYTVWFCGGLLMQM